MDHTFGLGGDILFQEAGYSQPDHTTAVLGPLSDRITAIERWQATAGAIAGYRSRWGVDTSTALGPEPVDPAQRDHWYRAAKTIESLGSSLLEADGDVGRKE